MFPKYELYPDFSKPTYRYAVQKHLNYEFRYEILENGVVASNRKILFNMDQIEPNVQRCLGGKCKEPLCTIPNDQFTTCSFEWSSFYEDPSPACLRGKRVEVSQTGVVTFNDVIVKEPVLDMNWRRLRNMAQPIVDDALGRLAIDGSWRTTPMRLQLGSMLVDAKRVRVDERSYFEMDKQDDSGDLRSCERAWKKTEFKRVSETAYEKTPSKRSKIGNDEPADNKENKRENENDLDDTSSDEETVVYAEKGMGKFAFEVKEVEKIKDSHCKFCDDDPCVWLAKKEDMLNYDDDEHGMMDYEDWPPNNVRRRKIYRQMTLFINEGPMGKGVRKELPECVVCGCRESFPSPTFMGFKEN